MGGFSSRMKRLSKCKVTQNTTNGSIFYGNFPLTFSFYYKMTVGTLYVVWKGSQEVRGTSKYTVSHCEV